MIFPPILISQQPTRERGSLHDVFVVSWSCLVPAHLENYPAIEVPCTCACAHFLLNLTAGHSCLQMLVFCSCSSFLQPLFHPKTSPLSSSDAKGPCPVSRPSLRAPSHSNQTNSESLNPKIPYPSKTPISYDLLSRSDETKTTPPCSKKSKSTTNK